ncbi:hypothetical protein TVAG_094600 [Trichomonas vaginalis G3]|uniref:RGS domain-containing protein n=1 Tax=Trichomonas vaginalis (strain ATCC PRA-98 / G3) TaxID=412133 RepID=A2DBT2_TRIV3|nr:RGS-like 4 domain-containing protein [Trichomonas vaginalis G3]EAY22285.1 hypothetical protein TVAG_094600 [Trichomonas vaginalis G3]KAI5533244.1 RGS-like 4 domain-containing protein [Trichomonas vaginalis G3]|eukprot:XP_001583271.1 hypothetical protein [Trichomonas vaginalis G3]
MSDTNLTISATSVLENPWTFIPADESINKLSDLSVIHQFYFYIFIIWSVGWFVTLIWYCFRIVNSNIQIRSPILTIICSVGSELTLLYNIILTIFTNQHFPCFILMWCQLLLFQLMYIPHFLKYMRYYFSMYQMERWKSGIVADPKSSILILEWYWIAILGIVLSALSAVGIVYQYRNLNAYMSSFGCHLEMKTLIPIVVVYALFFIVGCFLCYICAIVNDPYKIRVEFITTFVSYIIILLPVIIISGKNVEDVQIYVGLLLLFVSITQIMNLIRPIHLSYVRPPQKNSRNKILDTIDDIILDPETYPLVEQIGIEHESSECVPFIREILRYRLITNQADLERQARYIFDEYIRPDSPHQNNLPHTMVKDIEARIQDPTSDLFNGPYREIMKLLKTNFLPEIKLLPEYSRILHEREMKAEQERKAQSLLLGQENQ